MSTERYQLGVDVGGTFTDLVLWDVQRDVVSTRKELTTPDDPARGIFTGFDMLLGEAGIQGRDVGRFVHATTLVANAILERKGARTALVATDGFRDVLQIRRELRYDLFEQHLAFPPPLVPRARRFELAERTAADGSPLRTPTAAAIDELVARIAAADVEAVAVCLMHAYANAAHEQQVAAALRAALPDVAVSLSSEVLPQVREYERTSATVINAYVRPVVRGYLARLTGGLAERGCAAPVLVMTSTGGVVSDTTAEKLPILLVESGPAAGAVYAARLAREAGRPDLVAFDMGGTTAKVCVVEGGRPLLSGNHEVARTARFRAGSGMPIGIPVFDLLEIGAGGGSIARVDATGFVRVGPESAGSVPGPACYGTGGTRPTVTDANLVLGLLGDDVRFAGRALDREAARAALLEHVAGPGGLAISEAAASVHEVVTETMAEALRVRAVEHNVDIRRLELVSFGGAAGLHAAGVARRLGMGRVVCPPRSGVFSAVGLLGAPLAVDASQSGIAALRELDVEVVGRRFGLLRDRATAELALAGVVPAQTAYSLDMSYVGQEFEIDVPLDGVPADASGVAGLASTFEARYERLRGRRLPGWPARVVTWRVRSHAEEPALTDGFLAAAAGAARPVHRREIWLGRRAVEVAVHAWASLRSGVELDGPAIVQHPDTAVLVPDGATATLDAWRRLVIELGEEDGDA